MDFKRHRSFSKPSLKQFTLKATASALLALHAELVFADACPAEIYGDLSSIVCSVPPSLVSSFTVHDGATVGGISIGTPSTLTGVVSSITIDKGGKIITTTAATTTGAAGIFIHGEVLGNVSNSGSIQASGSKVGLNIVSTSTIDGQILNDGTIQAGNTGVLIKDSHVNNGIFNSGTISSTIHGSGIKIYHSTIKGNISNSGTIIGSYNDPGIGIIGVTISSVPYGSTITGDIINSGSIVAPTQGDGILINSTNTVVTGSLLNSGTISGGISGVQDNLAVIQGDIHNSGSIGGSSKGIYIHNGQFGLSGGGNIFNEGVIVGHSGDTINGGIVIISESSMQGGIVNSGIIIGNPNDGTSHAGILIKSTTMQGGIVNSGTIQGGIYIHNSAVNNIDILGQHARITNDVTAISSALNILNDATFTSEGNYDVDTFNIRSNAIFNMNNTVTVENTAADAFSNAGTLVLANAQTITGNYTQNTGGLIQTDVSTASHYGQLSVSGSADFTPSNHIFVQVDSNSSLNNGEVLYRVIGGTIVAPNDFSVSDNSFIWNFIPDLDLANNRLNLTATLNPEAYTACRGSYCQGAADVIIGQVITGNSLFSPYAILPTASSFQTAASQATPELTNENIQMVQLITRAVADIVPMWGTLRGQSAGDAMLDQAGKVWLKPYGASMTQHARNTVQGFDAAAYGAVIGKDVQLNDQWLFGGAFAAGGDNMQGKSILNTQSIASNAYQAMAYGAKKFPNQVYFAGQGLLGYENNHTRRNIPLYGSDAKGSYGSWFTNFRGELGWSKNVFSPNFVLTPEVDASYLYIDQGGYQESGSLMDLLVTHNNNSSLVLGAYCNGAYHLTSVKNFHDIALTGYAGLAGDVLNNQPQLLSTFVAGGPNFSTFGVQFNQVVFRGGVGLTMTSQARPLIFNLNYDLQAGNNAYSGVGALTMKYKM